jgi:hypothetical protein
VKATAAPNIVWTRADDELMVDARRAARSQRRRKRFTTKQEGPAGADGSRLANRAFRKAPLHKRMPGKIPESTPIKKLMPKFEGLKNWPVRAGSDDVAVMNPDVVVLPL